MPGRPAGTHADFTRGTRRAESDEQAAQQHPGIPSGQVTELYACQGHGSSQCGAAPQQPRPSPHLQRPHHRDALLPIADGAASQRHKLLRAPAQQGRELLQQPVSGLHHARVARVLGHIVAAGCRQVRKKKGRGFQQATILSGGSSGITTGTSRHRASLAGKHRPQVASIVPARQACRPGSPRGAFKRLQGPQG